MLLQTDGDTLRLAPAVPKAWTDFAFRLRAPGDLMVEATCKGGKLDYRLVPGPKNRALPKIVFR